MKSALVRLQADACARNRFFRIFAGLERGFGRAVLLVTRPRTAALALFHSAVFNDTGNPALAAQTAHMLVREASAADLIAILSIGRTTPWDKTAYLQRQLAEGNIAVAEAEGDVRGFIVWNREFFALPFVWLLAVEPAHRRGGIAFALFDYVERLCAGSPVYSSTNESNTAMHAFFAKRGYRRAGTADVDPGDLEIFYRIDLAPQA